jgi:hypothetical protein
MSKGNALAHGRAIAGARALNELGHISDKQRDKVVSSSQKAIASMNKGAAALKHGNNETKMAYRGSVSKPLSAKRFNVKGGQRAK